MARKYDNQQINNTDNVGTFQVSSDLQTLNCFNKDDVSNCYLYRPTSITEL